jgi:hypothetical protein
MLQLKIDVQDVQPLVWKFDQLKGVVRRKILRRANVSSARPPLAEARKTSMFVDRSGLLRKALGLSTKTYSSGIIVSVIGVNRNIRGIYKGKKRVPAEYAHLVELGHRIAVSSRTRASMRDVVLLRRNKKFLRAGQTMAVNAGYVQGRPFMGPSLVKQTSDSLAKFAQTFRRNLEREASR